MEIEIQDHYCEETRFASPKFTYPDTAARCNSGQAPVAGGVEADRWSQRLKAAYGAAEKSVSLIILDPRGVESSIAKLFTSWPVGPGR